MNPRRATNTTSDEPSELRPARAYTVALEQLPWPGEWAQRGACRGLPPELFVRDGKGNCGEAKAICRQCPVINQCRDFAVAAGPYLQGVWGGTSPKDRRVLKRQRRAS